MLTDKELQVKAFIEASFVPAIHQMMSVANTMHYVRYGGRCCKQIAYLLTLYLNKALPEYQWTAWESMFDEGEGWEDNAEYYSHAWTFGRSKTNPRHSIIMDYGKLKDEYSFFLQVNQNEYPKRLECFYGNEQDDYLVLDREETDKREELKPTELETFTQKPFKEILIELERQLDIQYEEVNES